MNDGVIN